jgi:hypothetical protein
MACVSAPRRLLASPKERRDVILSSCVEELRDDYERAVKRAVLDYIIACECRRAADPACQVACISMLPGAGGRAFSSTTSTLFGPLRGFLW